MKSAQGEMSKPSDSEEPVGCRDRTKGGKIEKQSRFFLLFFFPSAHLSSGVTCPTAASLLPLPQRAAIQPENI